MVIHGSKAIYLSKDKKLDIKKQIKLVPKGISNIGTVSSGIYKVDGTNYYAKEVEEEEAINELIGSILARELNLDSADYKIGIDDNNNVYAVSKLFYDDKYDYYHPVQFKERAFDIFSLDLERAKRYYCKENIYSLNPKMKEAILKLCALDIKMCQMDRHSHNIMIKAKKSNGEISFAPCYDYAFSYDIYMAEPERLFYDNPYLLVRKNKSSLKSLLKKYPAFYDYIKAMAIIDMEDIIEVIEKENDISLSEIQKAYYIDRDNEYSSLLKKI